MLNRRRFLKIAGMAAAVGLGGSVKSALSLPNGSYCVALRSVAEQSEAV